MAPDTAEMRPPRKGPTLRHARPDRREDWAATEVAATVTAQSISRDGARMAANLSPKHDGRRETRRPRCVYDYGLALLFDVPALFFVLGVRAGAIALPFFLLDRKSTRLNSSHVALS